MPASELLANRYGTIVPYKLNMFRENGIRRKQCQVQVEVVLMFRSLRTKYGAIIRKEGAERSSRNFVRVNIGTV